MELIALIVLLTLYFLPSIVALLRKAPDTGSVIVLNLLLGWTFLGWVISMAMAARSNNTASINVNVSQHPGHGYAGVAYGHGQPAMPAVYGGLHPSQIPVGQPERLPLPPQVPHLQPFPPTPPLQLPNAPVSEPQPSGQAPQTQARAARDN